MRDSTGTRIEVGDKLKSTSTGQAATVTKMIDFQEITFVSESSKEFTLSQREFYHYSSWEKMYEENATTDKN